jgi:hypothetical protein
VAEENREGENRKGSHSPASDPDHRYWCVRTHFVLALTLEQIFFNKVCYGDTRGRALLFSCFQVMRWNQSDRHHPNSESFLKIESGTNANGIIVFLERFKNSPPPRPAGARSGVKLLRAVKHNPAVVRRGNMSK